MDWIRELLALGFVMVLLCLLALLSRAKHGSSTFSSLFGVKTRKRLGGGLSLTDRLTLTPSTSLHLVHAENRIFLISVHHTGVLLLSELNAASNREPATNQYEYRSESAR